MKTLPWYRLEYAKKEKARFLSHREVMTAFQRALRRAALPLAYSRGFNPRPRLSFGPSLALGVAGMKECLDVELNRVVEAEESLRILNSELPSGLEGRRLELLPPNDPGLGKIVNCAWYRVSLPPGSAGVDVFQPLLRELQDSEGNWDYRKPGDGKVYDLAAGVLECRVLADSTGIYLDFLLKIGSGEVPLRGLLEVLGERAGLPFSLLPAFVERCGIYRRVEGCLVDPFGEIKALWEEDI